MAFGNSDELASVFFFFNYFYLLVSFNFIFSGWSHLRFTRVSYQCFHRYILSYLLWVWSTNVWQPESVQILLTTSPLSLILSFHCVCIIVVSVISESELCGLPVIVIMLKIWWTKNYTWCIQTSGKVPINTDLIKNTKDKRCMACNVFCASELQICLHKLANEGVSSFGKIFKS